MKRTRRTSHSLLTGFAVTAVSAIVGAGTAATALLITARTLPEGFTRPSTRNEIVDTNIRDSAGEMRVQERRNDRLQDSQELDESSAHESASESAMPESGTDRRAYFRAERWCLLNGYANSRRLSLCIHKMVETGVFENSPF